jgi:hypothetical protein
MVMGERQKKTVYDSLKNNRQSILDKVEKAVHHSQGKRIPLTRCEKNKLSGWDDSPRSKHAPKIP